MERERIERLDRVLALTQGFLEQAEDRVHRDIAPRLAATLRRWLGPMTGGRYVDASVDPKTLRVMIYDASGMSRAAEQLSHGTAEQVYLLLRLALAEHLTAPGEVCPLLLDEVTAHSDSARTGEILELLHDASRERQILLFTQEDDVLHWAEKHLDPARDRLVRLEPPLAELVFSTIPPG
jgi:uncharacterized protein YhaN